MPARPSVPVLKPGTGHCIVSLAQSVGAYGKLYGLEAGERNCRQTHHSEWRAKIGRRVDYYCPGYAKADFVFRYSDYRDSMAR